MRAAFIGKPQINFNLRLVGGDITTVPFVEKLLTNLIKNVLVNLMVWPNKLDIGITEDQGAQRTNNSGILRWGRPPARFAFFLLCFFFFWTRFGYSLGKRERVMVLNQLVMWPFYFKPYTAVLL